MGNTLKLGNGNWATKKDSLLAYNDENDNFKPLPFEFERASSATVVNKEGLIETVGNDIPRIDYSDDANGALLLEPQRTNLVTYSEDFSNAGWTKTNSNITSNAIISPDGSLNADKLVATSVSGTHQAKDILTAVSGNYTFSVFAKKGEYKNILLWDDVLTGGVGVNLDDLSVFRDANNQGYKIEDYGSGWIRISVNYTYTAQAPQAGVYIYDNSVIPQLSFVGNNVDGLYIYGAQLEEGSYATSLINTQGTIKTRLADVCLQGGFQDKNIFGSTQGTAVFDIKWDELNYIFEFNVGGVEVIRIYNDNNTQWRIRDTTTSSWYYTGFNITQGQRTKIGFKWSGTEIVAFQNGVKSLNNGLIGSNTSVESITTNKLNNTSNMQFYNTALTDQELQQLTTI